MEPSRTVRRCGGFEPCHPCGIDGVREGRTGAVERLLREGPVLRQLPPQTDQILRWDACNTVTGVVSSSKSGAVASGGGSGWRGRRRREERGSRCKLLARQSLVQPAPLGAAREQLITGNRTILELREERLHASDT